MLPPHPSFLESLDSDLCEGSAEIRTGDHRTQTVKHVCWIHFKLRRMNKRQGSALLLITFSSLLGSVCCQCEAHWRAYDNKCYFFSSDTKTWHDAQTDCEGKGSNLMSILDLHERTWVRTQIGTDIYWIGLNDIVSEGVWEWSDGSIYYPYLAFWRPGQPDNWNDNEDCGQVVGANSGQWNDEACTTRRRYICKRNNPNPPVVCDTVNGWQQFNSSCYKLKADTWKSWTAARTDCVKEGGDLVSIVSAEEEQYVTSRLDPSYYDLWLGYSTMKCTTISCQVDAANEVFHWSDATTSSYSNWGEHQPDISHKDTGVCAAIIKDSGQDFGKWRSHVCRYERPYMCKRSLNTICPGGWISFTGNCYWVVSNFNFLTSWHEAQSRCSDMGANLVTINNEAEQYFVNAQLPDLHQADVPDVWIGISDKDKDGSFNWVDKTQVTFSNWRPNFPTNTEKMWDCGQIYTGDYAGKWETTNCFKSLAYVCEMVGGQNVKPTAAPEYHCDTGYLLFGEYCYHFESESVKNWHDAEQDCITRGGHLASVHSQEDVSFLSSHMTRSSWVGLNDITTEGHYVWSDGTPSDFLPWDDNQPDNWQNNEDCIQMRGVDHINPGFLNDQFCTTTFPYICKKSKGQGPPPRPPTSGPGWNTKCGSWLADPFNDYCYLINYLSTRNWADARADCVNQGGDLLSITEPFEQAFIQAHVQQIPTGVSMWMGGHDSVTEGGWEWTDGSPFRFINWAAGNPDNYFGEDCLSILINTGYWNDDNCDYKRGYICKRRGKTEPPPPPHEGYNTVYICEGFSALLHCPENSVINIQSASFGRMSDKICPYDTGASGTCTVPGILPVVRKSCDNRQICFLFAHVTEDPCPTISKYMEVVYSCEQNVCLRGLGMEDNSIPNSRLSASSSSSGHGPEKARLHGDACWMPTSTTNAWIQVDLGEAKKVTGIALQGCPSNDHWVTSFKIQKSTDGSTFTDFVADGGTYLGNTDRTSVDKQLFGTPLTVRYIRLLPLNYNGQMGLRLDILGCKPDYTTTCSAKASFSLGVDRRTVHCPAGCKDEPYDVYGTMTYRGESSICAAALHAGVILNEHGGECTFIKMPGQSLYPGSNRNGITSKQYNGNYGTSLQFADGEMRCSGLDWYEFSDFCYKPFNDLKTWTQARAACRKLGGDLVSIMSMTEQSWLESYLYLATGNMWIGLNDKEVPGFFIWSDHHEVVFTYWAPGEPNSHLGFDEDCVEMLKATGHWNDVPCTELKTYICKMAKDHYPAPSVFPTIYGCEQGWDAYSYSCYWMEETAKTWSEAKGFCEEKNSKLLHIMDIYEQSHFTVKLAGYTGLWWTGLRGKGNDAGGVDYIWDNGAPITFTHWDRNQPDTGAGTCVAMTSGPTGGFWDDTSCEDTHPFVCEAERNGISPPTPAPTPPPAQNCEPGWTSESHFKNCYKLFLVDNSKKKTWQGAREDCVIRGGDLASIHSAEEENFLSKHSKGKTKWIGLQHNAIDGGYHWSDGSPVSHTNWGPGEPNNHGDREDCVEMVSNNNGSSWWNDLNCDAHQDYICMIAKNKKPVEPPTAPPPDPAPDCGSNPGWRKYNGMCYYYNDTDIVDFHTAVERCHDEEALLVSILDKDEQLYVGSMVGTGKIDAAWIGLLRFGVADGTYVWIDGSPVTFVYWGPGEPNNANGQEQCVQMKRYPGSWNDENCGVRSAGYVCKKYPGDKHTRPPPTQPWTGHCPEGWLLFRNKCYMFKGNHYHQNEYHANWSYARQWCRDQGGDLAVIDDSHENEFVSSYLRDLLQPVWIGLTDTIHETKFVWTDGSPVLYTNWADKEPNNNNGEEHCVAITHNHITTGHWNDDVCGRERGWVCYRKKANNIPQPPPTKSPCQSGYTLWYNNCYKLVEEPKTWQEAQAACEKEKANLASIDMSYDQAFISGAMVQGRGDIWIGLRRDEESGLYSWTDGWPLFYTHWGPGEPTQHTGEGCVSMHGGHLFHGTWNDTACSLLRNYICKTTTDKPPPTPPPGNGKCLLGWTPYGHHCYFVINGNQGHSWPEARHICQEFKAELASLHSRAEVEFLRNLNYTKYHNVWLGLTRDSSLGWAWTDGSSVGFLNWAPGEPNEAFHPGDVSGENCVEMYQDGKWNDNNCLQKRGYACRMWRDQSGDDNNNKGGSAADPAVVGAVLGTVAVVLVLAALGYYVFRVRGVKLSDISFPSRHSKVDVPNFNNPNFGGESDT